MWRCCGLHIHQALVCFDDAVDFGNSRQGKFDDAAWVASEGDKTRSNLRTRMFTRMITIPGIKVMREEKGSVKCKVEVSSVKRGV